jgi:hypothetical protein
MAQGGYALHRREDPDTSRAAAQAILAQLPALQQAVYAYALMRGADGFTDEEMLTWFMSHSSTYRSRRSELTRAGLIVDTGRRRLLSTRRHAIVWAIVPPEVAI